MMSMMDSRIVARCTIQGSAPLCQSRYYDEPKLEGETPEAYDIRTWRYRMHVLTAPGADRPTVHIPARAIHDALAEAAKYSKRQIPGQGKATWTKKFEAGIALFSDIDLGIDPDQVDCVAVYCHADGQRGSGRRVMRRFPTISQWSATFDVQILDPIITQDIFTEMLEMAGMFIGIGQNRPQNRGTRGRFKVESIEWIGAAVPDRRIALRTRAA
jgi:predicted CxxxxCH...CXXCH cytochrome family protein